MYLFWPCVYITRIPKHFPDVHVNNIHRRELCMGNVAFVDLTPFSMPEVCRNFGAARLLRLHGTLKMEATPFFETTVSIYPNTRCHIQKAVFFTVTSLRTADFTRSLCRATGIAYEVTVSQACTCDWGDEDCSQHSEGF
jgi:c-di-AMP phosphodiesterase-like protein